MDMSVPAKLTKPIKPTLALKYKATRAPKDAPALSAAPALLAAPVPVAAPSPAPAPVALEAFDHEPENSEAESEDLAARIVDATEEMDDETLEADKNAASVVPIPSREPELYKKWTHHC
eukprot:tig00001301_g8083.t1